MRKWFSGTTRTVVTFLIGAVVASAATAGAASMLTGKQIKDGSISAKDLSKAVRAQIAKAGLPGPIGDAGQQGPSGPPGAAGNDGAPGKNGSDATLDGVAAGGALDGTFPNPTLKSGVVSLGALSPDLEQGFQIQKNDRIGSASVTDGPTVDGITVRLFCTTGNEDVSLVNTSGSDGVAATSYVRGNQSPVDLRSPISNNLSAPIVDTFAYWGVANDQGTGQSVFWTADGRVWTLDFNYDATASYCSVRGVLRRG
jgi:hypothetical protein